MAAEAFVSGGEAAWRPAEAITAVKWFGAHGYAILGTELWLLQDGGIQSLPKRLSGLREVHGTTADYKNDNEPWDSYVATNAAETIAYLKSFNPADIVKRGDLRFQVNWITEADYKKLGSL